MNCVRRTRYDERGIIRGRLPIASLLPSHEYPLVLVQYEGVTDVWRCLGPARTEEAGTKKRPWTRTASRALLSRDGCREVAYLSRPSSAAIFKVRQVACLYIVTRALAIPVARTSSSTVGSSSQSLSARLERRHSLFPSRFRSRSCLPSSCRPLGLFGQLLFWLGLSWWRFLMFWCWTWRPPLLVNVE